MIKAWCERCPSVYNVYMIKVCCLSYKLFFTGFNKACRGVAATSFPQGFFCVWHFSYLPLFTLICVCFHHFLSSVLCQLCSLPELDKSQFGCVSLSRPISLVAPLPHSFSHSISLSLYIYMKLFVCVCCISHRMKLVLPVEYWPTSRTMGLLSKSASSSAGEWNSWNL